MRIIYLTLALLLSLLAVLHAVANRQGDLNFSFQQIPPNQYSERYRVEQAELDKRNTPSPAPKGFTVNSPETTPGQQAGQAGETGVLGGTSTYEDKAHITTRDQQAPNAESGAEFMRYGIEPNQVTGAPGQNMNGPQGTVNYFGSGGKPVYLDFFNK